ncbi:chromosome transmission fidelity protein 18 homolog [Lampris incognitus]|uniref:chromosome transmission fidelity protein 18 homolog n=1 Tax=Lampris incognitus TaxID=2546036 RepID=UPI0024B630AD|nr:chromosome transmission fidelity protein 18 homolog [Lampris incognitus]
MDEYDEMYGIEDDYEQQFADELEVLAEMDEMDHCPPFKRSGLQKQSQLAESSQPPKQQIDDIEHLLNDGLIAPNAKRQKHDAGVVKRLFESRQTVDITPPSSPEQYEPSNTIRSTPALLDLSGFGTLLESPVRPVRAVTSQCVLRRPPLEGEFISVTDSSGNRVYLRQKEDTREKIVDPRTVRNEQGALGLLATPFEVLREQVAERRYQQVLEKSRHLTDLLASSLNEEFGELNSRDGEPGEDNDEEEGQSSQLWVDRFSPKHYTELLSDEFTNRCLLKWLKLWDTVVFGRERKKSRPLEHDRQATNQNANRFKSKSQITEEVLEAELDQDNRPKFKVALLSGPPGLGKTTLAHVIAKHAGYNVVEINASDDRSAEVFQKRLDTATQMKSVLGANQRPNCLIIDEIDGAPAAAINILLATLNRKDGQSGEAGTETAKKKKKKESVLLRPIICICNDLYVPALRPLRQQAFMLTFPQTQPSRLAQRLTEISRQQGMKADTGTLMALCEKTDNDIRSCINTLQFLHGRGKRQVDTKTVQSVSVGQKDQNKGLFHLWQEVFQLPRMKRKRVGDGFEEGLGEGGSAQRFHGVLQLAMSSGEYEKVAQGLYDNYLSMRLRDPSLHNVCEALDWLSFSDRLNQVMLKGQHFSLLRYLPFLSVTFHFLFAHTQVPRINYPQSQHEALSRLHNSKNALSTMLGDIPACIRSRISELSLTIDILTLLLDILCPKLRPVNPQLFSSREKQQMSELIDTMLAYNLSYRQDRTPEGQYIYVLEPRVEDLVKFPGLPPRRQLTYQAKQTISREMEQEKMRRAEQMILRRNPTVKEETKQSAGPKSAMNHKQRLDNIVRQTTVEIRPEVDFFGRTIAPKPQRTHSISDTGEKSVELVMGTAVGNSDVWFRFNEGVSNAVRRNVYIRELL